MTRLDSDLKELQKLRTPRIGVHLRLDSDLKELQNDAQNA